MMRAMVFLLLVASCVAKPEATRDGGVACQRDEECNRGPLCGQVFACVDGFCSVDRVFRACPDGSYPDARPAGECVTYISCNAATCGPLVACVGGRCDPAAPRVNVPCDAGVD